MFYMFEINLHGGPYAILNLSNGLENALIRISPFQVHYNKRIGKCLIDLRSFF